MAKIAVLLLVVLVTGLVVTPAHAESSVANDYGTTFSGLAFILTNGAFKSCYDMTAHLGSTGIKLTGIGYMENNVVISQGKAVIGYAFVVGDVAVFGFEGFPTPAAQIAAKIGGSFLLSTLLGTGFGYHFLLSQMFPFSFAFRLGVGPCRDFVPA